MLDVEVIEDPAAAAVALDPIRSRLLSELARARLGRDARRAGSASRGRRSTTTCARSRRTGWSQVGRRAPLGRADRAAAGRHRRVLRRLAGALGPVAADPDRTRRPAVGELPDRAAPRARARGRRAGAPRARAADKHLATLSIDTEIRFRSAAERAAFSRELDRGHHRTRRPLPRSPRPPAAGRIGWWSWRIRCPREPRQRKEPVMPVKKDASGRRSVQAEVEVPGTPEEVWQAIATGPGISSWFVPTRGRRARGRHRVSHFGPGSMDSAGTITTWEPPRRFVAETRRHGPGPASPPSGSSRRARAARASCASCTAGSRAPTTGTTSSRATSMAGAPSSVFCGSSSRTSAASPARPSSSWPSRPSPRQRPGRR